MSKPLVERYEQILAQDPASTVFIELAKALIEKGELERAISICDSGLSHHPQSIVGRVLWGKALIHLGRPAEAMEQFDQAVTIDRENPHAYNLIAEVLLKKGLYRSALPLLKKGVALQPNDGRVRGWLEQTQRALAGGPAPALGDVPDSLAPTGEEPPIPEPRSEVAVSDVEKTHVGAPPQAHSPFDEVTDPSGRTAYDVTAPHSMPAGMSPNGPPVLTPVGPGTNGAASSFGATARRTGEHPALATMTPRKTGEHPTLSQAARITGEHAMLDDRAIGLRPAGVSVNQGATGEFRALNYPGPGATQPGLPALNGDAPPPEMSAPEEAVLAPELPPEPVAPKKKQLFDELEAPPDSDEPEPDAAPTFVGPPPESRRTTSGESKASLLGEIPDEASSPLLHVPKVEMSATAAKAIADQYEKELRKNLEEKSKEKTFLQRHGGKLAIFAVLGVAGLVSAGAYLHTQSVNRGKTLKDNLVDAKKMINQDTEASYHDALKVLDRGAAMDDSSEDVWALTAYAHSLLFAEHGGSNLDRDQGTAALAKPRVEEKLPGLALAAQYYLSDAKGREGAKQSVLSSSVETTEVQELAGRLLLAQKDAKGAVERFKRALAQFPNNVRALVALGNYYREAGDFQQALSFYTTAAPVAPQHPERVIGAAECRLEQGVELDEALKDVEALPPGLELPPDLLARKELSYGRLLAANGQADKAIKRLTEGVKGFRTRAFEFNMALGEAYRAGGDLDGAEKAYEAALKVKPKSEEAKEWVARVLIHRDREHEALSRLASDEGRRISLVRGIAYAKLADWKKVRSELAKTQVNGKYPSESVIYLALADAAEGQEERAQDVLEKTLAATKKAKSDLRIALGQVYWRRGTLDKARAQFEEAMRDPLDYEGACGLGRLRLSQGDTDAAIEKLQVAIARNSSHGEARHALTRAYLMAGRLDDALKQAQAWATDNANSELASRDMAAVLRETGKIKDAETMINRALKIDSSDPDAHRVRAQILFARGDPKGAFSELERANKMNLHDGETFCEIGQAFLRQSKADGAGKAYEAAKREDPHSACGAIGALVSKLPSGARQSIKELSELSHSAPLAWDRASAEAGLARAQLAGGQLKDARRAADDAVKLEPALAPAHYALGLVAWKQKDDKLARDELMKAEDLEPAHAGIHLALGDLLSRPDGDLSRAYTEYGLFLRTAQNPPEMARVKKMLPQLKKKLAAR